MNEQSEIPWSPYRQLSNVEVPKREYKMESFSCNRPFEILQKLCINGDLEGHLSQHCRTRSKWGEWLSGLNSFRQVIEANLDGSLVR